VHECWWVGVRGPLRPVLFGYGRERGPGNLAGVSVVFLWFFAFSILSIYVLGFGILGFLLETQAFIVCFQAESDVRWVVTAEGALET